MAKVKEYPVLVMDFAKDIIRLDFNKCKTKLYLGGLYFLDKTLKNNSFIRYLIWRINNRNLNKASLPKTGNIRFAIIYFSGNKFNYKNYSDFLNSMENQTYTNYDVYSFENLTGINLEKHSYICFVEQRDQIPAHALSYLYKEIKNNEHPDILYSDEDIISRSFGIRTKPYFKPNYSPLLLFSHNYMNAFLCIKVNQKNIQKLKEIKTLNQISLYELVLELTRNPLKILRIPDILYHRHWKNVRKIKKTPTKHIILDKIQNRKLNARIQSYKPRGYNQLKFFPVYNSKVSIIIPFKDKIFLLKQCLDSIETISTYKNYEVILVNNGSKEKDTHDYLNTTKYRVLKANIDFNYSKLNNMAANVADGDYLILLNNDTKVISPDWIESMLGLAQLPEVGAVGAKLLYANDKIQNAGVATKPVGSAVLLNCNLKADHGGYQHYNNLIREYICLTGACLMVSKNKYFQVNGLNEDLAIEYNDFDFCFKLLSAGYYNVYNPHSLLYHFESISRKRNFKQSRKYELLYMQKEWQEYMKNDPFYNPNFSDKRSDFSIRIKNLIRTEEFLCKN